MPADELPVFDSLSELMDAHGHDTANEFATFLADQIDPYRVTGIFPTVREHLDDGAVGFNDQYFSSLTFPGTLDAVVEQVALNLRDFIDEVVGRMRDRG